MTKEEEARQAMLVKLADLEASMAALPPSCPTDPITAAERNEVLAMVARMRELAAKVAESKS